MSIRIRPAALTDIQTLVALEESCFSTDKLTHRHFYYFIRQSKSAKILVAVEQKQLLGCCIMLLRHHSQLARVYSLAVHPRYRRQGIAHLLCDKLEKLARQHHRHCMTLEVRKDNKAAIRFYLQRGYTVFAEYPRYYGDGMAALRMRNMLK